MSRLLDIVAAIKAWLDTRVGGLQIKSHDRYERRMNSLIEHCLADPSGFLRLLDGMGREELADLYRRLDSRVQSWGSCLSQEDSTALNTLIRSRDETGLRLIAAGGARKV